MYTITSDNINVLFLHNPRGEIKSYEEIIDFMVKLKDEGKISKLGLSLAKGFHYDKFIIDQFDVIQNDINLLHLDPLNFDYGSEKVLMARSPLASGLLSDKMNIGSAFEQGDYRRDWLKGERLESLLKRVNEIKKIINGYSLPDVAKLFLLKNNKIDKIIFGIKSISHVHQISNNLEQNELSDDLVEKLINLYNNDFGLINEKHLGY